MVFPRRRLDSSCTEHRETHDASLRWVLERVRSTVDGPVVFVPGNHDMPVPPGEIVGVNADRQLVQADGLRVAGFGGAYFMPTPEKLRCEAFLALTHGATGLIWSTVRDTGSSGWRAGWNGPSCRWS